MALNGKFPRIIIIVNFASGYIFRLTFRSLSDVSYSDECRTKKSFYLNVLSTFKSAVACLVLSLSSVVPTYYLLIVISIKGI